jgi:hypothetical protein
MLKDKERQDSVFKNLVMCVIHIIYLAQMIAMFDDRVRINDGYNMESILKIYYENTNFEYDSKLYNLMNTTK